LAVLCACPFRSIAQAAQTSQITGIAHIAYRASDLDKEVAFLQKLGYEESFGFTNAAGRTTEVFVKVNDRQFIEVYPQTDPSQPLGWMHVCYESDDINALYTALTAHGLKPTEVRKAGAGNLLTTMKDPEDRVTEFTQYMPGSRHTLDKGLHLGEHRISEQMLGFELPVPDIEAARKFYVSGMRFEAREGRAGLRMRLSTVPDMRIEIRKAAAGASPETLFRVLDAAKTAQQLQAQGLTVRQERNRVLVNDPDGNVFAFVAPRVR
ncbi:MAG TPA: VOC family protein, partial [Terracidiphilus sp.]|nr:VOC family protein [Terracidiphilus sp.]